MYTAVMCNNSLFCGRVVLRYRQTKAGAKFREKRDDKKKDRTFQNYINFRENAQYRTKRFKGKVGFFIARHSHGKSTKIYDRGEKPTIFR